MPVAIRCALAAALVTALAMPSLPAAAQSQAAAADPAAAVPATSYQPSIQYRPEAEPEPGTTPDRNWSDSNATVAGYNSMALTMKMKRMPVQGDPHAGHDRHVHHGEAAPAGPAAGESP